MKMKKTIIILVNCIPAIIWLLWYLWMKNTVNDFLPDRGRELFILLTIVFIIFNTLCIKKAKWYLLSNAVMLTTNGFGSYFARVMYQRVIAESPLLRGVIEDETSAMVALSAFIILLLSSVLTYMKAYEVFFGRRRK